MTNFINIETAIGRLVLAGIYPQLIVRRHLKTMESTVYGSAALVCRTTGEQIAPAFRDGSTYKVKAEAIQDAIDDTSGFDLNETIVEIVEIDDTTSARV